MDLPMDHQTLEWCCQRSITALTSPAVFGQHRRNCKRRLIFIKIYKNPKKKRNARNCVRVHLIHTRTILDSHFVNMNVDRIQKKLQIIVHGVVVPSMMGLASADSIMMKPWRLPQKAKSNNDRAREQLRPENCGIAKYKKSVERDRRISHTLFLKTKPTKNAFPPIRFFKNA